MDVLTYNTLWIQKRSYVCIGHSLKHELWMGVANRVPLSPASAQVTFLCVLANEGLYRHARPDFNYYKFLLCCTFNTRSIIHLKPSGNFTYCQV